MKPMQTLAAQMSPTATKMIRMDHAHATVLFHEIEAKGRDSGARDAAVRALCSALEIHAQLEEELFYPCLRDNGVAGSGEPATMLDKSLPEHAEMKALIAKLRALDGQGRRAEQDDALHALMRAVMHHVADEENVLLPAAERFIGAQRLSELGASMTRRRLELARPQAGRLAADMARATPVKTALVALAGVLSVGAIVGSLMWRDAPRRRRRAWS